MLTQEEGDEDAYKEIEIALELFEPHIVHKTVQIERVIKHSN